MFVHVDLKLFNTIMVSTLTHCTTCFLEYNRLFINMADCLCCQEDQRSDSMATTQPILPLAIVTLLPS